MNWHNYLVVLSCLSVKRSLVPVNFSKRDESWLAYFLSWKCHRTHQGTTQIIHTYLGFLLLEFRISVEIPRPSGNLVVVFGNLIMPIANAIDTTNQAIKAIFFISRLP